MGFFKFPTTPHVLDLTNGKALTESDRLLSEKEAQEFFDAWQGKMSMGKCGVLGCDNESLLGGLLDTVRSLVLVHLS